MPKKQLHKSPKDANDDDNCNSKKTKLDKVDNNIQDLNYDSEEEVDLNTLCPIEADSDKESIALKP